MNKDLILMLSFSGIALIFCFMIFSLFGSFSNSNDYLFHFHQARGECFYPEHYAESCLNYPPLYHALVLPFAFSETTFFLFNFLFIFVLIPLTLRQLVKNPWIIAFYYAISTPFNMIYAGVFPQMVVLEIFLLYLITRSWPSRFPGFILVIFSFLTHDFGFFFMLIVFLLDVLPKKATASVLVLGSATFLDRVIDVFLKFPTIFLLLGLKKMVSSKDFYMLGLFLFTFLGAFFDLRVFLFTEIILIIPASEYMVTAKKSFKALMCGLLAIYYVFNLYYWLLGSQLYLFL